jgi:hypothetical protein
MDKLNELKDSKDKDSKIEKYIESLNPLEKIAYEIARSRLKTSFDIEKSIGFKRS